MTVFNLIPFSAFFLEYDNLVIFQVTKYFCIHRGAFYYRCAHLDLTVVVCEQDLVETQGSTFVSLKTVNIEFPTFFSLELFACDFYYYVHIFF